MASLQSRRLSAYQSLRRSSDSRTGTILCPSLLKGTPKKEATIQEDAESTITSYNKYRWVVSMESLLQKMRNYVTKTTRLKSRSWLMIN